MSGPPAEPATAALDSRRHAGRRSLPPSVSLLAAAVAPRRSLAREARRSLHQGRWADAGSSEAGRKPTDIVTLVRGDAKPNPRLTPDETRMVQDLGGFI